MPNASALLDNSLVIRVMKLLIKPIYQADLYRWIMENSGKTFVVTVILESQQNFVYPKLVRCSEILAHD